MLDLVILSSGEDRTSWLKARVAYMTATKACAVVGSAPYTKLIDVWNEFTDPDYNDDHLRNRWLEERAANGTEREPEIIRWASEDPITGGPGNPFVPNHALVTRQELIDQTPEDGHPPAATPDGYKYARDRALVLIEAKTTSQDWITEGIPQHIYDQCQWQIYVTGAVTVWVAWERVEWIGRGKAREAKIIERHLEPIRPDERRLAFMLQEVARFEQWYAEGIAPESDIELVVLADSLDWESTDEQVADALEAQRYDELLTELAEIEDRTKDDLDRAKVIKAELGKAVRTFDGRRVHLIGQRSIAKLVRYNKAKVSTSELPEETLRSITTWSEESRVVIEPNPEYTPNTDTKEIPA